MKRILFLTIIFTLFFIPCLAQDKSGKVRGVVVDWQEARVSRTTITFQNKQFKKVVVVNQDGEYEVELPVGSYTITAKFNGFKQYQRELVKVEANKVRTINIKLQVLSANPATCPDGHLCL